MQPQSAQDYKQLLTDVIKKQIVILGPDITLSKARNVKGLTVADDGTVINVEGSAQEVTQALIDQFVQLSGLIVKKTMEPLLAMSQPSATPETPVPAPPVESIAVPTEPAAAVQPAPPAQPVETIPPQPVAPGASAQPIPQPNQTQVSPAAATPTPIPAAPTVAEPAKNPLAA